MSAIVGFFVAILGKIGAQLAVIFIDRFVRYGADFFDALMKDKEVREKMRKALDDYDAAIEQGLPKEERRKRFAEVINATE